MTDTNIADAYGEAISALKMKPNTNTNESKISNSKQYNFLKYSSPNSTNNFLAKGNSPLDPAAYSSSSSNNTSNSDKQNTSVNNVSNNLNNLNNSQEKEKKRKRKRSHKSKSKQKTDNTGLPSPNKPKNTQTPTQTQKQNVTQISEDESESEEEEEEIKETPKKNASPQQAQQKPSSSSSSKAPEKNAAEGDGSLKEKPKSQIEEEEDEEVEEIPQIPKNAKSAKSANPSKKQTEEIEEDEEEKVTYPKKKNDSIQEKLQNASKSQPEEHSAFSSSSSSSSEEDEDGDVRMHNEEKEPTATAVPNPSNLNVVTNLPGAASASGDQDYAQSHPRSAHSAKNKTTSSHGLNQDKGDVPPTEDGVSYFEDGIEIPSPFSPKNDRPKYRGSLNEAQVPKQSAIPQPNFEAFGEDTLQNPKAQKIFPIPPLHSIADDDDLTNLLLSWYWTGYYTGYYQGKKRFAPQ